jgi:Protein of unknown function (DUF2958)
LPLGNRDRKTHEAAATWRIITGEPDARKPARPVRRGTDGKGTRNCYLASRLPYFDGEDVFFGWVMGFEQELGYFRLSELESVRGPLGLQIERDVHFPPTRLSEVKRLHEER